MDRMHAEPQHPEGGQRTLPACLQTLNLLLHWKTHLLHRLRGVEVERAQTPSSTNTTHIRKGARAFIQPLLFSTGTKTLSNTGRSEPPSPREGHAHTHTPVFIFHLVLIGNTQLILCGIKTFWDSVCYVMRCEMEVGPILRTRISGGPSIEGTEAPPLRSHMKKKMRLFCFSHLLCPLFSGFRQVTWI